MEPHITVDPPAGISRGEGGVVMELTYERTWTEYSSNLVVSSLSVVGDLTVGSKGSPRDTHVDKFYDLSRPQFGGVGVDLARKGLRDVDLTDRTEL